MGTFRAYSENWMVPSVHNADIKLVSTKIFATFKQGVRWFHCNRNSKWVCDKNNCKQLRLVRKVSQKCETICWTDVTMYDNLTQMWGTKMAIPWPDPARPSARPSSASFPGTGGTAVAPSPSPPCSSLWPPPLLAWNASPLSRRRHDARRLSLKSNYWSSR